MKKIILFIPILILIGSILISCGWEVPTEGWIERWIAIADIDGSNLEYLCKSGATPYFVPDLENPGEEIILLSINNRVDLINQDGTDRRTIIDSVGEVFSFSNDKTKMLLNDEGEIYIANVDGTEFQNLTNTPDIWEKDPSFSLDDEEIVFSYTLSNTHAFLVIKNLTTNQDSIVYEYEIRSSSLRLTSVSFRYPAFQNYDQILYRFDLIDQSEEPYIYRDELHRINIDTNLNEIIIDDIKVYNFVYNISINKCIMKTEDITVLLNMTTFIVEHEFPFTSIYTINRFSTFANYLTVGYLIYNFADDSEYYIETNNNDFNQNETKIVGINRREFPEDKED